MLVRLALWIAVKILIILAMIVSVVVCFIFEEIGVCVSSIVICHLIICGMLT